MIDVQTTKAIIKRILSIILGSSIWSWNNISIREHALCYLYTKYTDKHYHVIVCNTWFSDLSLKLHRPWIRWKKMRELQIKGRWKTKHHSLSSPATKHHLSVFITARSIDRYLCPNHSEMVRVCILALAQVDVLTIISKILLINAKIDLHVIWKSI